MCNLRESLVYVSFFISRSLRLHGIFRNSKGALFRGNVKLLPTPLYIGYSDNFGRLEMSPLNSHTNFIGYSDVIYWI